MGGGFVMGGLGGLGDQRGAGRYGMGWGVWWARMVGEDRMKGWESGGVGCVRVWSRCWCI